MGRIDWVSDDSGTNLIDYIRRGLVSTQFQGTIFCAKSSNLAEVTFGCVGSRMQYAEANIPSVVILIYNNTILELEQSFKIVFSLY